MQSVASFTSISMSLLVGSPPTFFFAYMAKSFEMPLPLSLTSEPLST